MQGLFVSLRGLHGRSTSLFIQEHAIDDQSGNTEPWRDLHHFSGRLLAYQRAIEGLLVGVELWPQLFRSFDVWFIPSSPREPNPLKTTEVETQTVSTILTSLMATPEDKTNYIGLAEDLQRRLGLNLDQVVKEKWLSPTFRLHVHAEVLLLNWLETEGGTQPYKFFRGWRYIGTSKPTCRMCHYYFSSHPSRMGVRNPHGNMYTAWRMPEFADLAGCTTEAKAKEKRQEMMKNVLDEIRTEVMRILDERVSSARRWDSATLSSFPQRPDVFAQRIAMRSAGASLVQGSSIQGVVESQAGSVGVGGGEEWDTLQSENDSGGEGGGLLAVGESSRSFVEKRGRGYGIKDEPQD